MVVDMLRARQIERGSHEWWLHKLGQRLDDRQTPMQRMWRYYHGQHNVKLVSERWKAEFERRFPEYADNFMPLVVDTENNRLKVQGIRYGDEPEGDKDAWRWWQDNHLDAESSLAMKDALMKGAVNLMVWPNERGEPEVSIEDALQTVVATVSGKRWQRLAGMKRWLDDDGSMLAELFMPDGIYRFRTQQRRDWFSGAAWASVAQWERAEFSGTHFIPNPLGVVPIVPLVNRPSVSRLDRQGRLLDGDDGESELAAVVGNQDHINAYRMMAVVASEFASFRQRYIIGLELPVDPRTGQQLEPFRIGVDRLIVIPPPDPDEYPDATKAPKVEFGEFEQTDTSGLLNLIREEVGHLSSKSQTPYHYFLGQSQTVPPSGESLKSSETGLVAKVEDAQVYFGEALEEVHRLQFLFRGDPRGEITDAEIIWADAESRNEAALTDTLVKAQQFGVNNELLQERWGMSPQEIERNRRLGMASDLRQRALSLPAGPLAEEPGGE